MLGEEAFAAAWQAGRALSMDVAIAEALADAPAMPLVDRPDQQPASAHPDGLTQREVEVLGLLAAGLSNREIAERLVVSVRTVGRHVDNIYGKIGVHDRGQARRYARERGLTARAPEAGT
jgi:DNA-binding NarL/FixJ family response regulator